MTLNQSKAWTLLGPTIEDYLDYEKANVPFFTAFSTITTAAQNALTTKVIPNPSPPPPTLTVPNGDIVVQSTNGFTVGQAIRLVPTGHAVQDVVVNSIDWVSSTITVAPTLANPMTAGDAIQGTQPRRHSYGESANNNSDITTAWLLTTVTIGSGATMIRQTGEAGRYSTGRVDIAASSVTGTLTVNIETSVDGTVWTTAATALTLGAPGVATGPLTACDQLIRLRAVMSGAGTDKSLFLATLYLEE